MKLFAKYNRINLVSTVAIFLFACIAFSFLIRYVVINQIDEDLGIEKNEILTYVNKYGKLPAVVEVHDQYTSFKPVSKLPAQASHIYTTTVREHHHEELARIIAFSIAVNHQAYLVEVSKSLEDTDNLIQSIILITVGTIVLILAATFFINRFTLHKLWRPFYNTLTAVQQFKLSHTSVIAFLPTTTDEFNLLNTTLLTTINKAQQDYQLLKEFTENASHEMQTPLAVIGSKLDVIIQSEQLTETQSNAVYAAYEAIKNLKKLNQSLLLLAKIENQQFAEKSSINLEAILQLKQQQFCEQWESRQLKINFRLSPAIIYGNKYLVDILVGNLISNATRHNIRNGFIQVKLQNNKLEISNAGASQPLDEHYIFSRFYKGLTGTGQCGLGLSIVKQICDVSGYWCHYLFELPNVHSFVISW